MNLVNFNPGETKLLRKKLKAFTRVIRSSSVLPVLEAVMVTMGEGFVQFAGTDLECYLKLTIQVAHVLPSRKCRFMVDFSHLYKFFFNAEGGVSIGYDDQKKEISMTSEPFTVRFSEADSVDNFVKEPELGTVTRFAVGPRFCQDLFSTLPWISRDELRPGLTGAALAKRDGQVEIVATDAHCLFTRSAGMTREVHWPATLILPRTACQVAGFMTEGKPLSVGGTHVLIEDDFFSLNTRIIDARYPNYQSIFPKTEFSFAMIRKQFQSLVRLGLQYVNPGTKMVIMEVGTAEISIQGSDVDFSVDFSAKIPVYMASRDTEYNLGANLAFVDKAIKSSSDQYIKIRHNNSPTQGFFIDDILVMPLMTNQNQ